MLARPPPSWRHTSSNARRKAHGRTSRSSSCLRPAPSVRADQRALRSLRLEELEGAPQHATSELARILVRAGRGAAVRECAPRAQAQGAITTEYTTQEALTAEGSDKGPIDDGR